MRKKVRPGCNLYLIPYVNQSNANDMTQSFSFFDNALLNATILATGEEFNKETRKEELKGLYRDCYRDGSVTCEGFTISRVMTEDFNVKYVVTYTA